MNDTMNDKIVTTTYNLNLEGIIVGQRYDNFFNRRVVLVKLTKSFGCHATGSVVEENIGSLVYKSTIKFNKSGAGDGQGPSWKDVP